VKIFKQLLIFFRLKIQETWKGALATCFIYWCSLWMGYHMDQLTNKSFGKNFYMDYMAIPFLGFFLVALICIILFAMYMAGTVFIGWIKDNWDKAGRILKKNEDIHD